MKKGIDTQQEREDKVIEWSVNVERKNAADTSEL